jgi:hypothetical protein
MRPITKPQSAIRAPLNNILGTEAHVRLLRILSATDEPLTRTRLAELSGLDVSGIARSLSRLADVGIVEGVGSGTRRPVRFRHGHPLAGAIQALFRAEQEIYPALLRRLTRAAEGITPPPVGVWVEGPVTVGSDRIQDALVLGVLAPSTHIDATIAQMEGGVDPIEQEFDVTIEVHGRTPADLAALRPSDRSVLRTALPLVGPPPLALLAPKRTAGPATRGKPKSHADLDVRSRRIAAAAAERLATEPAILERARRFIARRLEHAAPGERRELREWERILRTMSIPRLRRFLVDEGERATRLRQTSPFAAIASADEGAVSARDARGPTDS